MFRFLLVLMLTVCLSTVSLASSVGTVLDGYTNVGGGYWTNAAGDYFTYQEYTSYRTTCYRGCAYQQPVTYYYFQPASKPVSSLTANSADADFVDFLKQREKIQGAIALDKQKNDSFLAKLKAVGVTPPFPGLPAYNGNPFFGTYGATGNTLYGYGTPSTYSYSQVADIYGPIDLNVLFQQSSALAKNAQSLAGQANSEFNSVVDNANAGAAEVAKIKAEGEAAALKLKAVTPANRISTTVKQVGGTQPEMPKISDSGTDIATERFANVVKANCFSCHSGADAAGKFDMSKGITDDQRMKMLMRVTLPLTDKGHMPPAANGKPAGQLTRAAIRDLAD